MPRVFDHFTWIFVSRDGFEAGVIIRVDGSFFDDDGNLLTLFPALFSSFGLSFPLSGFIPLYFPAFLGFAAAFNRHFRAGFRLYYGI